MTTEPVITATPHLLSGTLGHSSTYEKAVDYHKFVQGTFGDELDVMQFSKQKLNVSDYLYLFSTDPTSKSIYWEILHKSTLGQLQPKWFKEVGSMSTDYSITPQEIAVRSIQFVELYKILEPAVEREVKWAIVEKFRNIEKVTAIYIQEYRRELQVIILLGIEEYDDELMDDLLDLEYDLHQEFHDPILSFSYIPRIYANRRDVVHPKALLIFER